MSNSNGIMLLILAKVFFFFTVELLPEALVELQIYLLMFDGEREGKIDEQGF